MLPMIRPLSAEERKHIGSTWAYRTETEAKAHLRFSSLAQALRVHGSTPDVIQLCHQAADNCQRHAKLCSRVALEFGIRPRVDNVNRPGPLAPADLSVDRKVLYEVVAVACVNEAMNGAILIQTYQRARWPSIKLAARTILDEKLQPSRFGWAHLDAIQAHVDFRWITNYLIPMMDAMGVDALVDAAASSPRKSPLEMYGELSDAERIEIFGDVMLGVVLPGFATRGIHTKTAAQWLSARLGHPDDSGV